MLLRARFWIDFKIRLDAMPHLVQRLRPEQIDRVQELAVLQQMAMAVPQPRNDMPFGDGHIGVFCGCIATPSPDSGKDAVLDREALGRWLVAVVSPDAVVAVHRERITEVGQEERVLLLVGISYNYGSDGRDDGAPADERRQWSHFFAFLSSHSRSESDNNQELELYRRD